MTNDQIKEKIRKVLALAQQGDGGEMEAAKAQLAAMLEKYGLRLEDITSEERREYEFKYRNKDEMRVFIHVLLNSFGSDADFVKDARQSRYYKTITVELTEIERIDVSNAYDYYRKAFAREKRAMLKALFPAFIHKHDLFDIAECEDEQPARQLSPEELRRILTIMRGMESPSYRKQLTSTDQP